MTFPLALGLVLMLGIVFTVTQAAPQGKQEWDLEPSELARVITHVVTRTAVVLLLWWVAYVAHLHV